jgi:hypothetical protein
VTSQVTGSPAAFGERHHATALRVEMCATWKRAPVSSASRRSRATITSSEPMECRAAQPHRFVAFVHVAARAQVQILAMIDHRQVEERAPTSMARRITRAFITGRPSSEMATMPAARMEPMAASSSPALPLVMAPMGNTLTTATCARARRCSW